MLFSALIGDRSFPFDNLHRLSTFGDRSQQRMFARRRNLLRAFETLDTDGSGQIDPGELR